MFELSSSLNNLLPGAKCKVLSVLSEGNAKIRMMDLGIIGGTNIEVLQKSPCGELSAYFIRGAVIALRDEDAKKIIVKFFEK